MSFPHTEVKSELVADHIEGSKATDPVPSLDRSYAVGSDGTPVTVLGTADQDPNVKPHISWQTWAILAICGLAQFQNVFIGIAPAANAYTIAGAVNGSDKRIWIVQAQAVPSIATGPIMAIISDVYGRRWVVLGAWAIFCIGSIISMTANGINQIIAGQVLTGCSAGVTGIMFAIGSEVLPSYYRSHAQTFINWISGLASILALIGTGAAVNSDHDDGWRWCFRITLILSALTLAGFAWLYKPPPRTANTTTLREKVKSLDWIGYFLLLAGLIPLLAGFAYSSDSNYGWTSPYSYALVAVGFAFFGICLAYEWKGTSTGFLDHRLFSIGRNFPICLLVIAVEGSLFYLMTNIYASEANGLWDMPGTINANARLLPFFMVITVLSPFISIYATKRKDIKWPLVVGFAAFSICIIGLAMSKTNGTMALIFNGIGGIGFAAPLILVMTAVQLSTPPLFIGIASALTISARTLGGTVGLAIAEGIYASLTNTQIPNAIAGAVIPLGFNPQYLGQLIGFLFSGQGLAAIPGINGRILGAASDALKNTQADAYVKVWFAFLPGTIIAAVLCAFLHNPVERLNMIVDAPLNVKDITHKQPTTELEEGNSKF